MLIRLVRMTFLPDHIDDFLSIYDEASPKIRAFEGCSHLELWQEMDDENVFTTCSHWHGEEALEYYRHSDLFRSTWADTKLLFAAAPEAHSFTRIRTLDANHDS